MRASRLKLTLVVLVMVLIAGTRDAQAYIDPGAGSYVLQILVATAVGGMFALKIFWGRVKQFFSKKSRNEEPKAADGE